MAVIQCYVPDELANQYRLARMADDEADLGVPGPSTLLQAAIRLALGIEEQPKPSGLLQRLQEKQQAEREARR